MTGRHKLEKIIYEADFDSEEYAYDFQTYASDFVQYDLAEVMSEVCDQLDIKDSIIRIKRMEFDLGKFRYITSKEEIKSKFRDELYRSLRDKISDLKIHASEEEEILVHDQSEYMHLLHYLQKGSLTWNSAHIDVHTINQALQQALEANNVDFISWLKREGKQEKLRKRIVYQFKDQEIIAIVTKVDAVNAPFISAYAQDLRESHKKHALIAATEGSFRNMTWEVILAYLLSDSGSRFNRKTFVKYTLEKIASRNNIAYGELLTSFFKQIPELVKNEVLQSEFPELIIELKQEFANTTAAHGSSTEEYEDEKSTYIREVSNALSGKMHKMTEAALQYLIKKFPARLIKVLRHYLAGNPEGAEQAEVFSLAQLRQLVQLLNASEEEFIVQLTGYLDVGVEIQDLKHSSESFKKMEWQLVLVVLLDSYGSSFNKKEFVKQVVRELAVRFGYSFKELMSSLYYKLVKLNQIGEQSIELKTLFIELYEETIIESQKRILPDNEVLQIIYTQELYDELSFYMCNGYVKRKSILAKQANGTVSLLQNLAGISTELSQQLLASLIDEKRLKQFISHTDRAFSVEAATLLFNQYYSPSSEMLRQFRKLIRDGSGKNSNEIYFFGLFTSLINNRGKDVEFILEALQNEEEVLKDLPLISSYSLLILRSDILYLLKGDITKTQIGLSLNEIWKYLLENHPAELSILTKYISCQPDLYAAFLQDTDDKILYSIVYQLAPSSYAQQFISGFTQSFGMAGHQAKSKQSLQLWHILLESFIDPESTNEEEVLNKLLTRVMIEVKDSSFKERSMKSLKDTVASFSTNEKKKVLTILNKVEEQLILSHSEVDVYVQEQKTLKEQALKFLRGESIEALLQDKLIDYLLSYLKEFPEQASEIIMRHMHRKSARKYWENHFSEALLLRIVFLIAPGVFTDIKQISHSILEAAYTSAFKNEVKLKSSKWFYLFETLMLLSRNSSLNSFRKYYLEQVLKDIPDYRKRAFLSDLYLELIHQKAPLKKDVRLETIRTIKTMVQEDFVGETLQVKKEKAQTTEKVEQNIEQEEIAESSGDALYIANAGIVLAAPSIGLLFDLFGLVEDNQFVDDAAADRAIHLLQYLVDESTSTPEFLLVLNKLICGVNLDKPIEQEIEITEREKQCIEQLIKDMTHHWKAMQNTTVSGFRETFLQRNGVLRFKEEWWELQVEEQPYDMLIDQIPWTFSTIRYPWMRYPLYVKWRQ